MRLQMAYVVGVAVLIAMLAGCGGSGEDAAVGPTPPAGSDTFEIGPLVVQTAKTGNFRAETLPSEWECSFVALYGAQINYLASTAMMDRLVFSSDRSGTYNLHVCNLDGSGVTQLTNNSAMEAMARWSPDGTKIAFVRQWSGQPPRIYTINADGTGVTALTDNTAERTWPAWSPDGGQIVYMTDMGSSVYDLFVMYSADGSGASNITGSVHDERHPAWSPDGTKILFSTNQFSADQQLAVTEHPGTITRLTNDGEDYYAPAWHPSGSHICFQSERFGNAEIGVMRSDGSQQRNFTSSPASDGFPRYSSDGRYIAFTSYRSGNMDIWLQETDTNPGAGFMLAQNPVGPARAWRITKHAAEDLFGDLGSPTVQTDRVLIGGPGADRFGNDPVYPSAPAVIVALNHNGYRNLVRIGVANSHLASLQIKPMPDAGWTTAGVEVSATQVANLREDDGLGRPPKLWDFNALNAGMVLLYFHGGTGKLVSAIPIKDVVYPTGTGEAQPAPYSSVTDGDGVLLTGDFPAVFDAEGHNLAPDGASSVKLGSGGEVLAVN